MHLKYFCYIFLFFENIHFIFIVYFCVCITVYIGVLNDDDEIEEMRGVLCDIDLMRDDGAWGMDVYLEAVFVAESHYSAM